uniref:DUF3553 domain-containing protein n=1 Tax=Leptospirillum ferrodiazotrophum TaxID=412449 RepID=C6HYT4_9BACT|nr:MAG: hypothetical protein UBAL3_94240166 [Leptospirillum ferrodiazotrophum]
MIEERGYRLYLRREERVRHRDYPEWGTGRVVETRESSVPGGACFVLVRFSDGQERLFFNDLNDTRCCYYTGILRCLVSLL